MKKYNLFNKWWIYPLLIGLFSPALINWWVQVYVGGISIHKSFIDVFSTHFNPPAIAFLAPFTLIPFAILIGITKLVEANTKLEKTIILTSGIIGIMYIIIPNHYWVWAPLYLPGHASSTAVISLLFIPFYSIPTMLLGTLIGWIIIKIRRLRQKL